MKSWSATRAHREASRTRGSLRRRLLLSFGYLLLCELAGLGAAGLQPAVRPPIATHTSLVLRETCGPYLLYPEIGRGEDGAESVVYFTAVARSSRRVEHVVAPAEMAEFRRRYGCASDPA